MSMCSQNNGVETLHGICAVCALTASTDLSDTECALCKSPSRQYHGKAPLRLRFLEQMIGQRHGARRFPCAHGCGAEHTYDEYMSHADACPRRPILCSVCDECILPESLRDHLQREHTVAPLLAAPGIVVHDTVSRSEVRGSHIGISQFLMDLGLPDEDRAAQREPGVTIVYDAVERPSLRERDASRSEASGRNQRMAYYLHDDATSRRVVVKCFIAKPVDGTAWHLYVRAISMRFSPVKVIVRLVGRFGAGVSSVCTVVEIDAIPSHRRRSYGSICETSPERVHWTRIPVQELMWNWWTRMDASDVRGHVSFHMTEVPLSDTPVRP